MPDIQKRPHNQPRHIVKEIVRIEDNLHLLGCAVDFNVIKLPDGRLTFLSSRKILKVMGSGRQPGASPVCPES